MNTTNNNQSAARDAGQRWKLEEDLDGCYVYPADYPPDDYVFRRVKPVAKIEDSDEALNFAAYLMRLPAFKAKRAYNPASKAMRLMREHIRQSNQDAVRDGSRIGNRLSRV
jgi:hypothetical protein